MCHLFTLSVLSLGSVVGSGRIKTSDSGTLENTKRNVVPGVRHIRDFALTKTDPEFLLPVTSSSDTTSFLISVDVVPKE